MPQLSPLNWMFLFFFFWTMMISNSSITWWNYINIYSLNTLSSPKIYIKYSW
uniref:ATP synthase F0 subunit 8 n=1 Tax=Cirroctopus glacialis TaxID=202433 RepID=UPI0022FD9C38|nr:ATP synthase F0 subunit 8 [Cirroctopus glacialis]WAP91388.1 ATP synthase F0 subunit 8 [Cirroctopus glacialis]